MKMTASEFLAWPKKAITIIGMSGLGKTHFSKMLSGYGWEHYSCDEMIGTRYLSAELDGPVTRDDLSCLSAFVGKIGNTASGGLALHEFKRRQKLYLMAECESLRQVPERIAGSKGHFVNDSTGSLCEIEDRELIDAVGGKTLFVYIRASRDEEENIIRRSVEVPKPMFFPPAKFDEWLGDFMAQNDISDINDVQPDEFSRWVFPVLFHSRLPKYQDIADRHGITIPSEAMTGVRTADDFINIIATGLRS